MRTLSFLSLIVGHKVMILELDIVGHSILTLSQSQEQNKINGGAVRPEHMPKASLQRCEKEYKSEFLQGEWKWLMWGKAIHALDVGICSGTNHWPMRQILAQVVAPLRMQFAKYYCLFLLTSSRPYYINLMLAWWKVFLWKYRKIKPFDIATTSLLKLWDFSYSVSLWFVCEREEPVTKNKENIRIIA